MTVKYPASIARFYDTIYHQVRDSTDIGFFLNEIKNSNGKVLEVGVGTGRLFQKALEADANVYGIDISTSMLDILYKKIPSKEHHRISNQNIIDFRSDFKFDLIIAPFRVLMHLIEKEDQIKALNNVCRHLNENGRFIFDVFIPDLNYLLKGYDNYLDFEGEYEPGKKIRRYVTTKPSLMTQRIDVTFNLEWDEKKGMGKDLWSFPMRFFFRYELEHLVDRSDFRKYEFFGDYQGNRISENSKDFIAVCTK